MKKGLLFLGTIIALIIAILVINTMTLTSQQVTSSPVESIYLPNDIFEHLSKSIQYPTISFNEDAIPDSTAFSGLHTFIKDAFPMVHKKLSLLKKQFSFFDS